MFIRFMVFVLGVVAAVILEGSSSERVSESVSVDGNGLEVERTEKDKEPL